MKYSGVPSAMWALFSKSFKVNLIVVLGYKADEAKRITKSSKPKYKEIIKALPEF